MSYPQYPGGYQPYPQAQGMEPSSATAMTAGVLASIGAVGQILGGVVDGVVGLTVPDFGETVLRNSSFSGYLIVVAVVGLITGSLLATGAVMMFRRKPLGRIFIVGGCALTIIGGIGSYIMLYSGTSGLPGHSFLLGGAGGLVGQVFPVLTAILALVPSTLRWLTYVPGPGYAGAYPGAGVPPGYPVPGGPYAGPVNSGPYAGQPGSYAGQPGAVAAQPGAVGGQPGAAAGQPGAVSGQLGPVAGQPGAVGRQPGAVAPDVGQAGAVMPHGVQPDPNMPYSNEPTPFPEVPPLDAAEDPWRRPDN